MQNQQTICVFGTVANTKLMPILKILENSRAFGRGFQIAEISQNNPVTGSWQAVAIFAILPSDLRECDEWSWSVQQPIHAERNYYKFVSMYETQIYFLWVAKFVLSKICSVASVEPGPRQLTTSNFQHRNKRVQHSQRKYWSTLDRNSSSDLPDEHLLGHICDSMKHIIAMNDSIFVTDNKFCQRIKHDF